MALTKAHNRMIEGSVFNILDYGAIPDDNSAEAAVANYNAIIAAMADANKTGTVYFPATKADYTEYRFSQTIDWSNRTGVCIEGDPSQLVFLKPANSFVGTELFLDTNTDGNTGWGKKIKNIVLGGKQPDLTVLNYIYRMDTCDGGIIFENVYFEEATQYTMTTKDSIGLIFKGCTFEDVSLGGIHFEGYNRADIHECSFNGGAPFAFTTESGYVNCTNNIFNSLSGGVNIKLMAFENNTIRNPNGSNTDPVMQYNSTTYSCRNNNIIYSGGRSENCTSVIQLTGVPSNKCVRISGNFHNGISKLLNATVSFVNLDEEVKFYKDPVSNSYYKLTWTDATSTLAGVANSNKYLRIYQNGHKNLFVPTNGSQTFTIANDESLVFDMDDLTFKIGTSANLTPYQLEIGKQINGVFAFVNKEVYPANSTFNALGAVFAYDDRL